MIKDFKNRKALPEIIREVTSTYLDPDLRLHHLGETPLPNGDNVVAIISKLRTIVFPGYFGRENINAVSVDYYIGELLYEVYEQLSGEIYKAFRHNCAHGAASSHCAECEGEGEKVCLQFMRRIPSLRQMLALDVAATYEGDPAAKSEDEIIFSYPGMFAITVYRFAHELHRLRVPLIPRIMTEYAHRKTGIDIHPGAQIGESFFIDHGTGVVIGETTEIGNRVRIYQGVTLGALSFKNGAGSMRGKKRHPKIEDNVVLYSGATILGGDTVIGRDSIIGGNVWIVSSVPPRTRVMMELPKLKVKVND